MRVNNRRWFGFLMAMACVFFAGMIGCKKEEDSQPKVAIQPPPEAKATNKDNNGKSVPADLMSRTELPKLTLLPFHEAVIIDEAPEGQDPPPDTTCNGLNTGKIFETIKNDLWNNIAFTDSQGKTIKYHSVMATELGDIHIDLFGDLAPNHVRNYVSLAKTGYFDGMKFYFSLREKVEDNTAAYIETGCPRGTGDPRSGSIGYWLKPEFSEKVTHEEGVVGACRYVDGDPNTAASRFYITAARMPQMDGEFTIFGKVSKGLDIVRIINTRAVHKDNEKMNRLIDPVLIRRVTINTTLE